MTWKIKLIVLPLMVALLPSCGLNDLVGDSALNESAIYDPPTVTLIKGYDYPFKEGNLMGRGQKFHSDFSYRRAIIIGNNNK
tara:strand:- start:137 stop:382 length:246 start_codon:yes stop_codon:yes gene_type:complete